MQQSSPAYWVDYFGCQECQADDRRVVLIKQLVAFLSTVAASDLLAKNLAIKGSKLVLNVDKEQLIQCGSEDLLAALELQPIEALNCIGTAAAEVWYAFWTLN